MRMCCILVMCPCASDKRNRRNQQPHKKSQRSHPPIYPSKARLCFNDTQKRNPRRDINWPDIIPLAVRYVLCCAALCCVAIKNNPSIPVFCLPSTVSTLDDQEKTHNDRHGDNKDPTNLQENSFKGPSHVIRISYVVVGGGGSSERQPGVRAHKPSSCCLCCCCCCCCHCRLLPTAASLYRRFCPSRN
ncbi:hypothetical protein VTK56DRAFT_6794 [Thermocarpiscus australiensis]